MEKPPRFHYLCIKHVQDANPQKHKIMKAEEIVGVDNEFVAEIKHIINSARQNAVRSVDFCRVQMYWNIGKRIFEKE